MLWNLWQLLKFQKIKHDKGLIPNLDRWIFHEECGFGMGCEHYLECLARVKRIAFMCKCHDHVKKLGEGKYLIFGKVVQIRFLQNRHLMVRVGGGWDTLEHYLIHHNPVQVFEHRRPNTANGSHDSTSKYLCFKSKYKSADWAWVETVTDPRAETVTQTQQNSIILMSIVL